MSLWLSLRGPRCNGVALDEAHLQLSWEVLGAGPKDPSGAHPGGCIGPTPPRKARHSGVIGHHPSFQTVQAYPACQQLQGLGQSNDRGVLPPRVSLGPMAALSLL